MYKIEFAASAGRQMEKIYCVDRKLFSRLRAAIDSLMQDPYQGKRLKGPLKGDFSLRVGDFRIIYTVMQDKLIVYIIDLGHRKDIYKEK